MRTGRVAPFLLVLCAILFARCPLQAQGNGVLGYWKEPGGSVIRVETCGKDVCAVLASVSPAAPERFDSHNPDATLRGRSLCGIRLGEGFQLSTPDKAEGGRLYDPKSGRTYRGRMQSHGDELSLRGYVGLAILGRTETWTRTAATHICQQ